MSRIKLTQILSVLFVISGCGSLVNVCLAADQNDNKEGAKVYDSSTIVSELLAKAMKLDSYAQDYIVQGVSVKRMYFQFSRNGMPFYRFRSEYLHEGKRFVHLVNVDGEHNYQYYPDEAVAYRVKTEGNRSESSYIANKNWHFDYKGADVAGEDVVNGKECYLLQKDEHTLCVSKKYGLQLDLRFPEGVMYYDNFDLKVSDDLFVLPETVRIIDR